MSGNLNENEVTAEEEEEEGSSSGALEGGRMSCEGTSVS